MIIEAKYVGPFDTVTVPTMPGKLIKQGETVKLRIEDGVPIGGCWEIVKGKKEYEAGLKAAAAEAEAKAKARQARATATAKIAEDILERASGVETAEPKSDRKGD